MSRITPELGSLLIAALLALLPSHAATPPGSSEEQTLIRILRSDQTPRQKDAACVELKRIGTAASVPALASLLTDESLSHSARLALESIPGPEADTALRDAIHQTTGLTRAGILDSIGQRNDPAAVPLLADLLNHSDRTTAIAAAAALGRIDSREIPGILMVAQPRATDPLRSVILDSLLQHANRALSRRDRPAALAIFIELDRPEDNPQIRSAVYRARIAAADADRSLALVSAALRGDDGPAQIAALSLLRDLPHPDTSQTLAHILPDLAPVTQAAVIEAMAQRGDRVAANAVLPLTGSEHPHVQLAAISAIGILGDHEAIPALLDATHSGQPAILRAVRGSLLSLRHGPITQTLLDHLPSATGPALTELIRALGERADSDAIPPLLELASRGDAATRKASFRALATLATTRDLSRIIQLLLDEREPATREEARRAMVALCRRAQAQSNPIDVRPIVQAVTNTTNPHEARVTLLQVCTILPDPDIRAALRTTTQDPHPAVRDATIRALCDTHDPALLPDLLAVARDPATVAYRLQAIRGFVRLATETTGEIHDADKVEHLASILELSQSPEEQRIVLSGLATQPTPESLDLVLSLLDPSAVQAEAIQAVVRITTDLASQYPELAESALRQALILASEPAQRQPLETLLAQIHATADYITAWKVAGPYRQPDMDYAALFDVVFPPEDPAATDDVAWITLPDSSSPLHPGIVDLLKSLGGEQCVAYVRTAVHSPVEQSAILELGTDDGVKAWLNGTLVHAHNVARPLAIGSDKIPVSLQPGWNTLLLKITQNNLGWEFTARFVQPDGSRIPDLDVDPLHATALVNKSAAVVPRSADPTPAAPQSGS